MPQNVIHKHKLLKRKKELYKELKGRKMREILKIIVVEI